VSGGTPNDVRGTLVEKHWCSDTTRHGMMAVVHIAVEALQCFFFLSFFFSFNCFFDGSGKRPLFFAVITGSASGGPFPCTKADGVSSFSSLIDYGLLSYEALCHALKREIVCPSETSVNFYQTAQHHTPEYHILNFHRRENENFL